LLVLQFIHRNLLYAETGLGGNKGRNESQDKNHQHLSKVGIGDGTEALTRVIWGAGFRNPVILLPERRQLYPCIYRFDGV
jgi:hypothetical protein